MSSSMQVLRRAIAILQCLNRTGGATATRISRETGIAYVSGLRVLQTLEYEGLVVREWKTWRVTDKVRTLSQGFRFNDPLVEAARPHLVEMTHALAAPVTLATPFRESMMVRDCTHQLATPEFASTFPGYLLPMRESAAGRVYLAHCNDNSDAELEDVRDRGYAIGGRNLRFPDPPAAVTVATPLFCEGRLLGSLAFSRAPQDADEQSIVAAVERLREAAARIGDALGKTSAGAV